MKLEIKLNGLKKFEKQIKEVNNFEARIGFLGDEKNNRKKGEMTNANLAALHHFGNPVKNLPRRSPFVGFEMKDKTKVISDIIGKSLEKSLQKRALTENDVIQALKMGGLEGENLIEETFATKGFQKWEALKPSTLANKDKNKDKILIREGELVNARISKVIKK